MKYYRKAKNLCLIMVSIMILQLSMPMSFARAEPMVEQEKSFAVGNYAEATTDTAIKAVVDTSVIDKIEATKGGKSIAEIDNYRPTIGDEVTLRFDFTLPVNHNYGDGSKLTYPLPTPLKPASGSGTLQNESGEVYATFNVDGDNVIITFNDNIRFRGTEGTGGLETIGFFEITAKYEADENNTNLEQDLTLPGYDKITLNFKPAGGKIVDKIVDPSSGNNINSLKWIVDVNTVMDDLGVGVEFTDTLTGNHKYNPTSLKVTQFKLGTDGKAITTTDVTIGYAPLNADATSFTLNLTGKYAYKIEYETIPGDTEEKSQTLGNNAVFKGQNISKKSTIQYGDPLTKTVSKNGEQANWTIKVNGNKKTLPVGMKIVDGWDSNKHELVPNTFKVNGSSEPLALGLSVVHNAQGFELTLGEEITDEFTITYSTRPKDLVTGTIDVKNTVYRSDRPTDKKNTTAYYSQAVLSKTNSNINYQDKTVDWKIDLNTASYEMDTILLTDTFVNKNLKIINSTFVVKKGSTTLVSGVDYIRTDTDGDILGDKKGGFTLSILNSTRKTDKITITYKTEYYVRGVTNLDIYKNNGVLSWNTGGKSYLTGDVISSVTINNQQKYKGYKDGVYNYEKKKFEWNVGINYNFDKISNPIYTDTLSESQIVDRNSIKIYKLNLSGGGNGVITGEPLIEGTDYTITPVQLENEFTITFNKEINEAYRIVYESTTKLDYYAPKGTKHVVTNNAKLTDNGTSSGSWTKTVTVEHSEKLITKGYNQVSSSAKLNWTMNLNWSQSTLKEVVITDTVGKDAEGNPNQMVYKDSFKIIEMNFSGLSSTPTEGNIYLPGSDLYDVTFDEPDSTFKITFKKSINKAYVVKYDTYFLGQSGNVLENIAKLSYKSNQSQNSETDEGRLSKSFTFTGGASATKGQLEITKVDKDNINKKLSGAQFELWSAKTGGFLIERVSIDNNGVYTFQTKVGQTDYYLKETKAPMGYSLDESAYKALTKVTIKDNSTPSTKNYIEKLKIENTKINQAIKLIKVDAVDNNIKLQGAVFTLHNADGIIVEKDKNENDLPNSFETNELGIIFIDNLAPGNYKLVEISAPSGYWLDTTPIEFNIVLNQLEATSKTVTNTKSGELIIKKVDAVNNSKLLPGVVFKLYNVNDTESPLYTSSTTGENGIAKFINVKYGNYVLKETTTPTGYVVKPSNDGNQVIINSKSKEITIENELINQAVRLTKVDSEKNEIKLDGAKFTLHNFNGTLATHNKDGIALPESFITSENGEIMVNNLSPGNYYFMETDAPDYYLLLVEESQRKHPFTIKKDQTTFTEIKVENTRGKGSIIITKVDEANNDILLDGVEFNIINSSGTVKKSAITVNGKIEFANLPYDTYTITETKANIDYVPNGTSIEVVLDGDTDGIIIEKIIKNTKKDYSVELTKYNNDKSLKLKEAIFELRKEIDGVYEVVTGIDTDKLTTDDNGVINLKKLEIGKYQLIEIKAPAGYKLNSDPVNFEIKENQTVATIVEKLNSRKSSGGGGTTPQTPKTPEAPVIPDTPKVPDVPEKPVIPTEPELPIVNPIIEFGNILINKLDLDSNPLKGAEFTLYDESKTAIRTVASDVNGTALFSNLPLGIYSVMETKAPDGYELVNDDLIVNIKDSKTLKYNFRNAPEGIDITDSDIPLGWEPIEDIAVPTGTGVLPNTGSIFGTFMLILIGVALMLTGFGMLFKKRFIG